MTAMMVGEAQVPGSGARQGDPSVAPRLVIQGLTTAGESGRAGLNLERLVVHPREIVGVAGVSGNGQKELVEVLGGQRRAAAGDVLVEGEPYRAGRAEAQGRGVRVLPEEPLRNGCVPSMSVEDNLALRTYDRRPDGRPRRRLDRKAMAGRARAMIRAFAIKTASKEAPIATLSGGNVQRCVLARELDGEVRLLAVANPCFGLDVKAAAETRGRIMAARNAGAAVLLISEDLDEIMELADRIVVMREGRITYETPASAADLRTVGGHMAGHH
jgi:simple sugar transport system ATP-binding protein